VVSGSSGPRRALPIEQEEFERGHIGPDEDPVEPRPAATVVLARSRGAQEGGFEVLLLRRPEAARFAAGAFVFPGGVIDPADHDPGLQARLARPGSGPPPEAAALAAGIRELFEETGILPADRPPAAGRAGRAREALLVDRASLVEVAAELHLSFQELRAVYFARWITPERLARRYDTRFFLLSRPADRLPDPELTGEHTAFRWVGPRQALEEFRRGELPMLLPTWKTLERLARYPGLEEALADLRVRDVQPDRPRLIVEEGGVRPALPGDPGYERGR
jgi:8-oxo-dGTP pyrophosphatase MutT (NUDIX family)